MPEEVLDTASPEIAETEVALETTEVTESSPSDNPEELKAENEKLREANRKLYERATRAETKSKTVKKASAPSVPQESLDDFRDEIRSETLLAVEGYAEEEIENMTAYAIGKGKKFGDVKNDPFIQSALAGFRERKKTEVATPPPSSRVATQKSTTQKDWANMTPDERRGNFAAHSAKFFKKQRSNM